MAAASIRVRRIRPFPMSANNEPPRSDETVRPSATPSSFQFSIRKLLIVTASVAVFIVYAPVLYSLAQDSDYRETVDGIIGWFVYLTSLACPYLVGLAIFMLVRHPRYWMLALSLLASAICVLGGWVVLYTETWYPDADPNGGLFSGFGAALEWMLRILVIIFLACLTTVLLAIVVHRVLWRERKALQARSVDG